MNPLHTPYVWAATARGDGHGRSGPGVRREPRPSDESVLLQARAGAAARDGVRLWRGNEMTWLAEGVPQEYLTRYTDL